MRVAESTRNKKQLKRKAKRDFEDQILIEMKRANDLSEQELKESKELRLMQLQVCKTIEKVSSRLLETFQNHVF